jgi:uncharacterized protein (TIGR00369 family)
MMGAADQTLLPAFPTHMGISLEEASPDRVVGVFPVEAEHANRNGVLHGGAIMAFADALGGVAAALNLSKGQRTTTLESKTNFLPAIPLGTVARATCLPLHLGRSTTVFQITITREDGKVAAIVTQTQLTLD